MVTSLKTFIYKQIIKNYMTIVLQFEEEEEEEIRKAINKGKEMQKESQQLRRQLKELFFL